MKFTNSASEFNLVKYFSVASLVGILLVAVFLAALYRYFAISTLEDLGETVNLTLARTALHVVQDDIVDYLQNRESGGGHSIEALATSVNRLRLLSHIAKIKIFDHAGIIVYSTEENLIDDDESDDPDIIRALQGQIASELVYRDALNVFYNEASDENLVQSYLPINAPESGRIVGVFEIYTDISDLASRTQHFQILILPMAGGTLLVLYLILIVIVRRAERLINRQENTIRERNSTLEMLSAKLLTAQEEERKNLAYVLHEDVIQTLSAIKLRLTGLMGRHGQTQSNTTELRRLDDFLKQSIDDIRSLATRIRPSSLDDLGLIKTLDWYFRQWKGLNPHISLSKDIDTAENEIPLPLKTVIFRIVQDECDTLAADTAANRIHVHLAKETTTVALLITENSVDGKSAVSPPENADSGDGIRDLMRERTVLSGGEYSRENTATGLTRHASRWLV